MLKTKGSRAGLGWGFAQCQAGGGPHLPSLVPPKPGPGLCRFPAVSAGPPGSFVPLPAYVTFPKPDAEERREPKCR